MLGLIARYDGIDLPGDSCRLLILDGLPCGESLIDRFVDENIQVETIRVSHTATRVVQAIGRIFRSNTDHGVVLLVGPKLQAWVRAPRYRTYLPELLQKQLLLGFELSKHIDQQETTWEELIQAILSGDANWDHTYSDYIDEFESHSLSPSSDWHVQLILEERVALDHLWTGQFQQAVDSFGRLADRARDQDRRLAAWYRHWRGLSWLCAGDRQAAYTQFIEAANVRSELGRPPGRGTREQSAASKIGPQAKTLAKQHRSGKAKVLRNCDSVKGALVYGSSFKKAEEALKQLGLLLGLQALRPDKSLQTGPDVIWQRDDSPTVWGFELKTNKSMDSEYAKRDIAQCHDHRQWLIANHGDHCELTIVGPIVPVSEKANPFPELRITRLEAFQELLGRAKEMHDGVMTEDNSDLERSFQSWLNWLGLNWPDCVESLENRLAVDLVGE